MGKVVRSYCGLCHPRCGILLHIKYGKVEKVTGDPDHPITRGAICERGRLMQDHIYHPQRLNYPLKRTGERGQGSWERLLFPNTRSRYGARWEIPKWQKHIL